MKSYLGEKRQLTFICDRQKGNIGALPLEFPQTHVRHCARHILANVKSKHLRVKFSGPFWATTKVTNKTDFNATMEVIKSIDIGAYETLWKIHPKFWLRHAFDQICKPDHTINNMTECFNGWLRDQRKLPIIHLLEFIRKKLIKKLVSKRRKAIEWQINVNQKKKKKMALVMNMGRNCVIMSANDSMFKVDDKWKNFIVDLATRQCDCGK